MIKLVDLFEFEIVLIFSFSNEDYVEWEKKQEHNYWFYCVKALELNEAIQPQQKLEYLNKNKKVLTLSAYVVTWPDTKSIYMVCAILQQRQPRAG